MGRTHVFSIMFLSLASSFLPPLPKGRLVPFATCSPGVMKQGSACQLSPPNGAAFALRGRVDVDFDEAWSEGSDYADGSILGAMKVPQLKVREVLPREGKSSVGWCRFCRLAHGQNPLPLHAPQEICREKGLKVGGKKSELIQRIIESRNDRRRRIEVGEEDGGEGESRDDSFVDVTEYASSTYVDDGDDAANGNVGVEDEPSDWDESSSSSMRELVDTSLYRKDIKLASGIEAYVVAEKSALEGFLRGGGEAKLTAEKSGGESSNGSKSVPSAAAAADADAKWGGEGGGEGQGEGGAGGTGKNRSAEESDDDGPSEFSISAKETRGVILLVDDTSRAPLPHRLLADKLAFETSPSVVILPDFGYMGSQTDKFERCTAEVVGLLKNEFACKTVGLFGIGNGAGRALECSLDGGPTNEFSSVVAWRPTAYTYVPPACEEPKNKVAAMVVYWGADESTSRLQCAAELRSLLASDPRVSADFVKIFNKEEKRDDTEEIALLLSTAWMTTYGRSLLPTK